MNEGARCYYCDKRITLGQLAVLIPIRLQDSTRRLWARAHVECQPSVITVAKEKGP